MKNRNMTVKSINCIQDDIYKIKLYGDCNEISAPGQFVNIKLKNHYLRRPLSIADYSSNSITLIFKIVGKGTEDLSKVTSGSTLDLLIPLGNGFDISKGGDTPTLIGGGIGLPPIYSLAKTLVSQGKTPKVIIGFNNESDIILVKDFNFLGIDPIITTADGSVGTKGFVTDVIDKNKDNEYIFACGPEGMLKALWSIAEDGQFSFEARMACGFGACMGCSCKTKYGYKRICKDGPVLEKEEIIW